MTAINRFDVLKVGTNPASTGVVRLPNNSAIYARNAANGGDVALVMLNASDKVSIDSGAAGAVFGGTLSMAGLLDINSNNGWKVRNGASDGITLLQYNTNSWRINGLSANSTLEFGGNLTTLDIQNVSVVMANGLPTSAGASGTLWVDGSGFVKRA